MPKAQAVEGWQPGRAPDDYEHFLHDDKTATEGSNINFFPRVAAKAHSSTTVEVKPPPLSAEPRAMSKPRNGQDNNEYKLELVQKQAHKYLEFSAKSAKFGLIDGLV